MKKNVLFVFKDSNLANIIKGDGQIDGPADFSFGMNFLDKDKYAVDFINAPRGEFKNAWQKFFHPIEKIFSRFTHLGIALEIYPIYKKQIKAADTIFCSTDGIGMGIIFWKRLGFIKADIIFMAQALPERIKYFRRLWPIRAFISWLLQKASTILTFTDAAQSDFSADFKLSKNKLKTLPFGIDENFWKKIPEIKEENFIISIGNDGNRDYQTLVEALPENINLKIITKRKIDKKNKLVDILSGLPNEEVRDLYNKSLFAVIPSIKLKNESPGQSTAMQLMACGKAVIIPRLPTMEEIFTDNVDCLFYEPENAADLLEKIKTLFNNKVLRDKIASGGHKKVIENFTCQKNAERLEKIIG